MSHGLEDSVAPKVMQEVIQWLIFSLINAEYFGQAHLFWLDDQPNPAAIKEQQWLVDRQG